MLNNSSVEIGVNLSEVLIANKCQVTALPGSFLNELTRSIQDKISVCYVQSNYGYENKDQVINAIITGSEGDTVGEGKGRSYQSSEHDTYMDNYLDELSVILSNHLNFARNTVNKEVNKLIENVSASISNYRHREAEDFFNVTYYTLPAIYSTATVVEATSSYDNSQHVLKAGRDNFDCSVITDAEDITSFFSCGCEEEDLILRGFIAERKSSVIHYVNSNVEEYRLNPTELLDYHLVNYLLNRNIVNGMDFSTNEALGSLKRKAVTNRDYHGASLANALKMYSSHIKSGTLLVNSISKFSYFNETTIDLVIYEENFAKLAEQGFGIDAIFGCIASSETDCRSIKVDDIVSLGKTYIDRWNRTRSLYLIHLNSKRIDIFKHLLYISFDSSIVSNDVLTDAEKEFCEKDSSFLEVTRKLVYEYIENLTVEDIEALEDVCRTIVAKYRFRFSNAYDLLNRMAELLKADPELDPMTAGLYSACDYMLDYCFAQTQVVKL